MKIKNGKVVNVHYVGTLSDGTEFDNSRTKGTRLKFEIGSGRMLPGFENAVISMNVGETKKFSLTSEQAYGSPNPEAVQSVPRTQFGTGGEISVGTTVTGQNPNGQPVRATVKSIDEDTVLLDFNHPLAGKDLNFDIELLSVE